MPEKCSYKYLRVGAYLAELLLQILTPLWQLEINAGVPRESHSSPIKGWKLPLNEAQFPREGRRQPASCLLELLKNSSILVRNTPQIAGLANINFLRPWGNA